MVDTCWRSGLFLEQKHSIGCLTASITLKTTVVVVQVGARCSSVVRAFTHGAMGRQIDPLWWTN